MAQNQMQSNKKQQNSQKEKNPMQTREVAPRLWGSRGGVLSLRDAMDQIVRNMFDDIAVEPFKSIGLPNGLYMPHVDVADKETEICVTAELPGMDEKNVEVTLTKDNLILKGEKKEETKERDNGYYRHERHFGEFLREIPLPCDVQTDKTKAVFKNGVLTVTLAKATSEQQSVKKIPVQGS